MQSGKKLTLGILPTFLCLLSLLVVACGGGSSSPGSSTAPTKAADNKQVFYDAYAVQGGSDVKSLDPALLTDTASNAVVQCIFTGLVTLDEKLQLVDELAASHSVAADGVTYTFKLRPNLKFSDGTALTSQDVVYSIDRSLQKATKSPTAGAYLTLVKDSEKALAGTKSTLIGDSLLAPDPSTVVIVTNAKAAYFLYTLTYADAYVVEKKLIDQYGAKFVDHLAEGGGSGPFVMKKYTRGQEIDLVPNTNYYGAKPQLKELVFPFYKEGATAYKAYQTGAIEFSSVPVQQLASAKQLTNEFKSIPQLTTFYYAMNYLVKPWNNVKVRQAFALAINKDEIVHAVYKDTQIATNHIVPKGAIGYSDNLKGPDGTASTAGNPTLAKQLLQQGLKEEGLTTMPPVTAVVASNGSAAARSEFAAEQQMWQNALGVTVNFQDEEFGKLLDDINNATNNPKGIAFYHIGWVEDYPDAQDWLTLQFDKGSPNNTLNYGQNTSARATAQQANQALMRTADANVTDSAGRVTQYNTAEQSLVTDVAWLPTFQQKLQVVRKACVVGYPDNGESLVPPQAWANIYKSTDPSCGNVTVQA